MEESFLKKFPISSLTIVIRFKTSNYMIYELFQNYSNEMPNVLSKVGRLKISLERRGHVFPVQLNLGEINDAGSPYKMGVLLRFADRATKMGKLDRAYETLLKAILAGSLEAINDPLIELVTIS